MIHYLAVHPLQTWVYLLLMLRELLHTFSFPSIQTGYHHVKLLQHHSGSVTQQKSLFYTGYCRSGFAVLLPCTPVLHKLSPVQESWCLLKQSKARQGVFLLHSSVHSPYISPSLFDLILSLRQQQRAIPGHTVILSGAL